MLKRMSAIWLLLLLSVARSATTSIVFTVALDRTANFSDINSAVKAIPKGSTTRHIIRIYPGKYYERINVTSDMGPVTFESTTNNADDVLIRYDCATLGDNTKNCTACQGYMDTVRVSSADFIAQRISFANGACNYNASKAGQSVAVQVYGNKATFHHVKFYGSQDTLYLHGATANGAYFNNCYINGSTDSIYGHASAVFNNCEIQISNYYTAHAGDATLKTQFLFENCTLSKPSGIKASVTYLGRPWRNQSRVIYKNCWMGNHIIPAGWNDWGHSCTVKRTGWCKDVFNAEYGTWGPGKGNSSVRVAWSYQLTAKEAENFTMNSTLNGWVPPEYEDITETSSSTTSPVVSSSILSLENPQVVDDSSSQQNLVLSSLPSFAVSSEKSTSKFDGIDVPSIASSEFTDIGQTSCGLTPAHGWSSHPWVKWAILTVLPVLRCA